jgi:hypothetical protein
MQPSGRSRIKERFVKGAAVGESVAKPQSSRHVISFASGRYRLRPQTLMAAESGAWSQCSRQRSQPVDEKNQALTCVAVEVLVEQNILAPCRISLN